MTTTTTFLLTDVEGSTRLWESSPSDMRRATAEHDGLMAEVVEARGGTLVRGRAEGDSAFAVFDSALDAAAAALDFQRQACSRKWPGGVDLAVRMALHSGQAGDAGFYGPVVNRCARVRGIAHGGQVLLSAATVAELGGSAPAGASFRDLGIHRLKDLGQPEQVFQLCHADIPTTFPPVRSLDVARHNLPDPASTLVGRDQELADVRGMLAGSRLVTLVGLGGVGKTRLAIEAARSAVDESDVWWVDLSGTSSTEAVQSAIAAVLGVRDQPGRALLDTAADRLRERATLLVLDNCEHVVDASAAAAEALLRACRDLTMLATSREPLAVPGEAVFAVGVLATTSAAELFADRARVSGGAFALDETTRATVELVCARLDGLPLAVEMAAAQSSAIGLAAVLAGLEDRLGGLTGGAGRQQTLRATLDWSHALLEPAEQVLFRRMAVFAGSFTLEEVEAICGDEPDSDLIDAFARLVDKSLVTATMLGAEARYRLLETVRHYALERLRPAAEEAPYRNRHLEFFMELARIAYERIQAGDQVAALDLLETEHDNIDGALAWAEQRGDDDLMLGFIHDLWWYWERRGHWAEGRRWLERMLAAPTLDDKRAEACTWAGMLASRQGDLAAARRHHERAIGYFRGVVEAAEPGSERERAGWVGVAHSLHNVTDLAKAAGDLTAARASAEEALEIRRGIASKRAVGGTLAQLGSIQFLDEDFDAAGASFREALAIAETLQDKAAVVFAHTSLGAIAARSGDLGEARDHYAFSLDGYRALGDPRGEALTLYNIADAHHRAGDAAAREFAEKSRTTAEASGAAGLARYPLHLLGRIALRDGDLVAAAGFFAKAAETASRAPDRRADLALSVSRAELARRMGDISGALKFVAVAVDALTEAPSHGDVDEVAAAVCALLEEVDPERASRLSLLVAAESSLPVVVGALAAAVSESR